MGWGVVFFGAALVYVFFLKKSSLSSSSSPNKLPFGFVSTFLTGFFYYFGTTGSFFVYAVFAVAGNGIPFVSFFGDYF